MPLLISGPPLEEIGKRGDLSLLCRDRVILQGGREMNVCNLIRLVLWSYNKRRFMPFFEEMRHGCERLCRERDQVQVIDEK